MTDKLIEVCEKLDRTNAELASTTALIAQMVASATNMKHEQSHLLKALMSPFVNSSSEEGSEVRILVSSSMISGCFCHRAGSLP